jgi:hypothetical protein
MPAATEKHPVGSGVIYGPTSLAIALLTLDDFKRLAGTLGAMERSRQWWIGDLLVYGEQTFDEPLFLDALDEFGLAKHTLVNYRSIAARVDASVRREALTFSHHAEVAYLERRQQVKWLDKAERDQLDVKELRALVHPDAGQPERLEPLVELTPSEDAAIAKRLERIERAFSNGIRYVDASKETTVEDLVWLLALAKRLTR